MSIYESFNYTIHVVYKSVLKRIRINSIIVFLGLNDREPDISRTSSRFSTTWVVYSIVVCGF